MPKEEGKPNQTQDADEDQTEDEEETDPWFVIKPENSHRASAGDEADEDEGTDPESEGDDVADEDVDVVDDVDDEGDGLRGGGEHGNETETEDEDEDGDEWVKVPAKEEPKTKGGAVEDSVSLLPNLISRIHADIRCVPFRMKRRYLIIFLSYRLRIHH